MGSEIRYKISFRAKFEQISKCKSFILVQRTAAVREINNLKFREGRRNHIIDMKSAKNTITTLINNYDKHKTKPQAEYVITLWAVDTSFHSIFNQTKRTLRHYKNYITLLIYYQLLAAAIHISDTVCSTSPDRRSPQACRVTACLVWVGDLGGWKWPRITETTMFKRSAPSRLLFFF